MVHAAEPCAAPDPKLLDQVTVAAAFPPDAVPVRLIVPAVVVAGGGATLSVNGGGAGLGVGDGAVRAA